MIAATVIGESVNIADGGRIVQASRAVNLNQQAAGTGWKLSPVRQMIQWCLLAGERHFVERIVVVRLESHSQSAVIGVSRNGDDSRRITTG